MLSREQLRTARTKFIHRWHAAETIGERFGNDAVGERFEHINHAKSLAEYIWRYGLFVESADGTGRDTPRGGVTYSLRDVVAPIAAKGRTHLRNAVYYACIAEQPQHKKLQQYAERHPDIRDFAGRIIALHRGMLRYYVQMRLFTPAEAEYLRNHPIPLVSPLGSGDPEAERVPVEEAGKLPEDLIAALQSAFERNIYNALVPRNT